MKIIIDLADKFYRLEISSEFLNGGIISINYQANVVGEWQTYNSITINAENLDALINGLSKYKKLSLLK